MLPSVLRTKAFSFTIRQFFSLCIDWGYLEAVGCKRPDSQRPYLVCGIEIDSTQGQTIDD